jgi:hypothetical protein
MSWFFTSLIMHFTSSLALTLGVTGTVGVICIAVWFLAPTWLPFNRTHMLWAGLVSLGGGIAFWYVFHQGEAFAYRMVAAQNTQANARVRDVKRTMDQCDAVNWDVTTGTCNRR